ncbi:uncharacterized protein K441DRAFT_130998 [Cenococcum geophilum 1.58]|uniref:uncharacterized protein n=1 Tax=Cenococcum geophilum 1.58 TaxID=794803 RepID=UPI00358EDBB2|nr:hypothetical protein K441DRAFT_130998 [Cenococcum geophilum 1.58]
MKFFISSSTCFYYSNLEKVDLFGGIKALVEFLEIIWAFFFFLSMFDFSIITILIRNWVRLNNWKTARRGQGKGVYTCIYRSLSSCIKWQRYPWHEFSLRSKSRFAQFHLAS